MLEHEVISWREKANQYNELNHELVLKVGKAKVIIDTHITSNRQTVCVTADLPRSIKKPDAAEIWMHYKMGSPDFKATMDIDKKTNRVIPRAKEMVFHGGAVRLKSILTKAKTPPGSRLYQLKVLDDVYVQDVITKFKPYIYGTRKNIHDPDCQVFMKADIWIHHGTERTGQPPNGFMTRATIDLAAGFIRCPDGKNVDAINTAEVLSAAEDALDKYLKS